VVVNVAALEPAKDQRTLIHAAHAARGSRPDLHWVIAGDGPERRALAREVANLDLADRVHLLGHVAQADALLRESDVVVMSSRAEGLGSVVLHALALGKPSWRPRAAACPRSCRRTDWCRWATPPRWPGKSWKRWRTRPRTPSPRFTGHAMAAASWPCIARSSRLQGHDLRLRSGAQ